MVSSQPFSIQPKVTLPLFEKNGSMHLKISFNEKKAETFLIDYGGQFDIELSQRFYNKNKASFPFASKNQSKAETYGLNGSRSQEVRNLKCNIDLEGVNIPNVNITIRKGIKNRLGLTFLSRFKKVAINSSIQEMSFGESK